MNRAQIIRKVMSLASDPSYADTIRQELIPQMRKFRPGRFNQLSDIRPFEKLANITSPEEFAGLQGAKAVHVTEHTTPETTSIFYKPTIPGVEEGYQNTVSDTKTVLHELIHELQRRNPEFTKEILQGKAQDITRRHRLTGALSPDYSGIRTNIRSPEELTAESMARHMVAPETLKNLPIDIQRAVPEWFEKYRAVPLAVGGAAAAGATLAPEESEAAMSLKEPIKLAKTAQKTLSKDWDLSSTAKALVGKVWNGREIQAVYKPRAAKPSPFKPGHPDYKAPVAQDKRAVVFSDGSYNMLDTDDLRTVVSALGSDEYMGRLTPQLRETGMKEKAMQSLRMKNWMNIGHDTLEEAEKTRKKYARDWVDLFGGQGIGIETIEYMGKYRNMSAPYVDVLREVTPKIISNLEASVKEFKKALKPVPKAILEKLDELKSIKFFKNQSTYLSKYGFRGRDWTTPEGWEDI